MSDISDLIDFDSLLTTEERALRDSVRSFVNSEIKPNIAYWYEKGHFPVEIVPELAKLGLLGMHLKGYGCAGRSAVDYGLAGAELEAGDSGTRTLVSVQGSLAMSAIYKHGSEEQKQEWLPAMAAGEAIGCFGLTEPTAGSDPGSMTTFARRDGSDWVLNGAKRWIGLASVAKVAIIWAQTNEGIRGFVVPTSTPGFTATPIEPKLSMRASIQCDIALTDVRLPETAVLPNVVGLKGPFSCLNEARYGIIWGAMGAARDSFEAALDYSKGRMQFDKPLAGYQMTQQKLVDMALEINKGFLLALHLGRKKDAGTLQIEQISVGKLNNCREAIKIAREARTILGGNGITLDYSPLRHANNLESVRTYEGTDEIHTLILGHKLTGRSRLPLTVPSTFDEQKTYQFTTLLGEDAQHLKGNDMSKVTTRHLMPTTMTTPGHESRAKAWGLTSVLVLLYSINYSDKILLGLVAQPLKEEFGLTSAQIGLTASVFFFAFSAGGFFAGLINKWATLKWSLLALAVIWAACMVPMIVAGSFMVLLVSRFLLGLTEGPSGALIHTAVYSWHPMEKRSLPGAFIASSSSLAKIAAAPALAFLIVQFGWHSAFIAMVVVGLGWCVLWYFTWRPGPYGEVRIPVAKGSATTPPPTVPWMSIFRTGTFLGALAAVIPMYALLTVVLTWLPSYFEVGLGFTRLQAGAMFGFPSMAAMVAMFASTYFSDRFMSKGVSSRIMRGIVPAAGLLVCGVSMAVLPYIDTPMVVVAVVSIGYGIGCILAPIMNAAISQICPMNQVAGSLGMFLALMAIGGIVAPPLTGMIVDQAVSPAVGYAQSFQIFGIVAIVGAILAMILVNPDRDSARVMGELKTAA